MKFLDYSRASIAEILSHCYVAWDQHYIDESEMAKVRKQADTTSKKVNNFITYLNMTLRPRKSTNKTNKTSQTSEAPRLQGGASKRSFDLMWGNSSPTPPDNKPFIPVHSTGYSG